VAGLEYQYLPAPVSGIITGGGCATGAIGIGVGVGVTVGVGAAVDAEED